MNHYVHLEIGIPIQTPIGYFTPQKEVRLEHEGREVLYVVSEAMIDANCCLSMHRYALIPGYVVAWQSEKDEDDLPVSEVEPVADIVAQERIKDTIKQNEEVSLFEFW